VKDKAERYNFDGSLTYVENCESLINFIKPLVPFSEIVIIRIIPKSKDYWISYDWENHQIVVVSPT